MEGATVFYKRVRKVLPSHNIMSLDVTTYVHNVDMRGALIELTPP